MLGFQFICDKELNRANLELLGVTYVFIFYVFFVLIKLSI